MPCVLTLGIDPLGLDNSHGIVRVDRDILKTPDAMPVGPIPSVALTLCLCLPVHGVLLFTLDC